MLVGRDATQFTSNLHEGLSKAGDGGLWEATHHGATAVTIILATILRAGETSTIIPGA